MCAGKNTTLLQYTHSLTQRLCISKWLKTDVADAIKVINLCVCMRATTRPQTQSMMKKKYMNEQCIAAGEEEEEEED